MVKVAERAQIDLFHLTGLLAVDGAQVRQPRRRPVHPLWQVRQEVVDASQVAS